MNGVDEKKVEDCFFNNGTTKATTSNIHEVISRSMCIGSIHFYISVNGQTSYTLTAMTAIKFCLCCTY